MTKFSVGMAVYVNFTSDSRTEFSGNRIEGKAILDRVEDGYIYGRMVENQQPFMCNEGDATPYHDGVIKGTWQIVQWCPDLVTREWLNIGVGFKHKDECHFKYLDHFKKIEQLYDSDTKNHLIAVLKLVKSFFSVDHYNFSPQIKILEIGFSKGVSIQENLNRSYERVVTLRDTP